MITKAPPIGRALIDEIIARVLGPAADLSMRDRLLKILLETAIAGSTTAAETLGVQPTLTIDGAALRRLVQGHAPAIAGINETTRNAIREALYDVVQDGGDLDEQVSAVRGVFRQASRARAVAIARTESGIFWHAGSRAQGEEAGARSHTWLATRDPRVRASHRAADGQCRPIDQPYEVGGEPLLHPCDPGGSPENIINCYLPGTLVSGRFVGGVRSEYKGPARHIVTSRGHRLSVTPNHPVLTPQGWIAAGQLRVDDYLLCDAGIVGTESIRPLDHHEYEQPASVADVFEALRVGGTSLRHHLTPDDLHGDARFIEGEVEIVRADGLLWSAPYSARDEFSFYLALVKEAVDLPFLTRSGPTAQLLEGDDASPHGLPRPPRLADYSGAILSERLPFEGFRGRATPERLSPGPELAHQLRSGDARTVGELLHRRAGAILLDQVVEIRDEQFRGHVYDLQSYSGLMLASNIVCSNCRCTETFSPHSCAGKARKSYDEGTRIWKRVMRSLAAHERLALVTMRRIFRDQRVAVVAELQRMAT